MTQGISEDEIIEQKADSLIAKMSLEEKIGQMTMVRHFDENIANKHLGAIIHTEGPLPGETALEWQNKFEEFQKKALSQTHAIPLFFGVDAVHGQNTFEGATIFPHNIGFGASGNIDLVKKAAEITAIESRATGFHWVFSPCIAIPYNEKWGRVYEAFSESTEVTTQMARASVEGHQGSLTEPTSVMATAKHFIGDGATDYGIEGAETTLDLKEVMERLLPPYRAAIEAGVGAVMTSFNTIQNISMHAHKTLITDTLKNSMGFEGIVVTDWKGYSRFGEHNIINAGIDMVMAVDGDLDDFQQGLKKAVQDSLVAESRINDAVRRILKMKFKMGLFKDPYPSSQLIGSIGSEKHREVAKQAVRESLVLLKNHNNILPLKPEQKIIVVGEFADNSGLQSGGWTIHWQGTEESYKGATTILDGFKEMASDNIIYDKQGLGKYDGDVAVIVVGEKPYAEFFGDVGGEMDMFQLTLTEQHKSYIDTYHNKGIPVVVVLISGRPLIVTDEIEKSNAFVAAWLPGSEGDGIAEVLFGKHDFKGKLPHSWPKSIDDFNGKYGPNFWDKSIEPLYSFGYGLNYNEAL
ncbi:glycoside hydrolase family 3 C-terminal domain-containing protein [Fulvivirga lutea]|uniref:beta-glucosidase n=2 Tax=Fulvivirga lutea TaxID=2810512 RepID=A0A974WIX9_9BACT|nr:glycoside hydrolase family 3 C-terminal domain-containing protein [Fulvivirga lutea]